MARHAVRLLVLSAMLLIAPAGVALAQDCSGTSSGQDRTVPLRFTAIWAKRPSGIEFVSWQSTGIPPRQ